MFDFLKFWKKKEGMPSFPEEMPPEELSKFGMQEMPPHELPPEIPGEMPGISAAPQFEPTSAMAPEQPPVFGPEERAEAPQAFREAKITPLQPAISSSQTSSDKEFQLINTKLDAIKASIDGLHQRLDKLELEKERRKEEREIYTWR